MPAVIDYPLIWVKAKDTKRVALAENHPAHPDGSCMIAGDEVDPSKAKVVQVAKTPRVSGLLGHSIIEVEDPNKPKGRGRKGEKAKEEAAGQ